MELECPECGHDFLHQRDVEVFRRMEDADSGVHTVAKNGMPDVDTDLSENPSLRRGGTKIHFDCELGCEVTLCIIQHKGREIVEWE